MALGTGTICWRRVRRSSRRRSSGCERVRDVAEAAAFETLRRSLGRSNVTGSGASLSRGDGPDSRRISPRHSWTSPHCSRLQVRGDRFFLATGHASRHRDRGRRSGQAPPRSGHPECVEARDRRDRDGEARGFNRRGGGHGWVVVPRGESGEAGPGGFPTLPNGLGQEFRPCSIGLFAASRGTGCWDGATDGKRDWAALPRPPWEVTAPCPQWPVILRAGFCGFPFTFPPG